MLLSGDLDGDDYLSPEVTFDQHCGQYELVVFGIILFGIATLLDDCEINVCAARPMSGVCQDCDSVTGNFGGSGADMGHVQPPAGKNTPQGTLNPPGLILFWGGRVLQRAWGLPWL